MTVVSLSTLLFGSVLAAGSMKVREKGGLAAQPISAEHMRALAGADTGIRRCNPNGSTNGCPGKGCSGGDNSICVICNHEPFANEECSSSGTGPQCTMAQLNWCKDRDPPINGTKGYCLAGTCYPYHPAVYVGCGVYTTCP